jgi:hypothetical protein
MKRFRFARVAGLLLPGALLLQSTGCDPLVFNEFLQTILLGITAAGAVAILQNT